MNFTKSHLLHNQKSLESSWMRRQLLSSLGGVPQPLHSNLYGVVALLLVQTHDNVAPLDIETELGVREMTCLPLTLLHVPHCLYPV